MSDKKSFDERSERSIPLNIETVLVKGAREPKRFNPDDENEAVKKDEALTWKPSAAIWRPRSPCRRRSANNVACSREG